MSLQFKKIKTKMSDPDTRRYNEDVLSRCEEGDMIEFPRGKFSHFGLYAGNGKVIHLTGKDEFSNGQITEDSFWDVVGDSLAKINNYLDKKKVALSGREIVRRAREKIGTVGYNLLWKNCEHFVTWCRYGEGISEQVWNFVTNIAAGGAAILATLLAVSYHTMKNKK